MALRKFRVGDALPPDGMIVLIIHDDLYSHLWEKPPDQSINKLAWLVTLNISMAGTQARDRRYHIAIFNDLSHFQSSEGGDRCVQ